MGSNLSSTTLDSSYRHIYTYIQGRRKAMSRYIRRCRMRQHLHRHHMLSSTNCGKRKKQRILISKPVTDEYLSKQINISPYTLASMGRKMNRDVFSPHTAPQVEVSNDESDFSDVDSFDDEVSLPTKNEDMDNANCNQNLRHRTNYPRLYSSPTQRHIQKYIETRQ